MCFYLFYHLRLFFVFLIGISNVKSGSYPAHDSDGIVFIANGSMQYYTNVHQVIYEMDATTLFSFVDLIVNIFGLLSAANQMYSEKFRCKRMWSNRDFDPLSLKLDLIDRRKNKDHKLAPRYFEDNEPFIKYKIISEKFNVMDDDLMHDLYNIHKKLDNITYSPKAQYSVYGPKPVLTKFLQHAYDVSTKAAKKYQPILFMLDRMNVTDLVEYDNQYLSLIAEMQDKPNNTFLYNPVTIYDSMKVINIKTTVYVIANIYITEPTIYYVHILHSLMVTHLYSTLTTFLKKPGDIFCINRHNDEFFYMSWKQNSKCFIEKKQKLCPLNPKLRNIPREKDCVASIYCRELDPVICSKDLMYSRHTQKTSFERLDSNAWYHYIRTYGYLSVFCEHTPYEQYITGTGLILLNDGCNAIFEEDGSEEPFTLFADSSKETQFYRHLLSYDYEKEYDDMLHRMKISKNLAQKAH